MPNVTGYSLTSGIGTSSASITPGSNRLVCVFLCGSDAGAGTHSVSGCGLTWTKYGELSFNGGGARASLHYARGASPSTGTLSFGGQAGTFSWNVLHHSVTEFADCDSLLQITTNTGANFLSIGVSLGSFSSANNGTFCGMASSGPATAGSGFTVLNSGDNGSFPTSNIQWKAANDTSIDWSVSYDSAWAAFGAELQYTSGASAGQNPSLSLMGVGW